MCGSGGSAVLDVVTQGVTGGLVGYDEEGGFGSGRITDLTVSGLKKITGAEALEEANKAATKRYEEEKAAAEKARSEAKAKGAREQVVASRLAKGARTAATTSATQKGGGTTTSSVSALGADEVDFLGV